MLTELRIQNFKCFKDVSLRLFPLTLFTGLNAAGKSTTLQSFLLLSQALRYANKSSSLPLNGTLVRLGTPGEILRSGSGTISFSLKNTLVEIEWVLHAKDRIKISTMQLSEINIKNTDQYEHYLISDITLNNLLPLEASAHARQLVNQLREIIFLGPSRIGTPDVFPAPENSSPVNADVGVNGEFAPWWFHQQLDEDIDDIRCNPADPAKTLRRQLNAWVSELFPNVQANTQAIARTNLVRLEMRIGDTGDWRRPANIGYGLTYVFPIIVAGLLAKPGQILIIDSPEAHLHPKGQSQMGFFLAKIAAAGVQVFVETHSDHFLNGIRRAIGEQKILNPDQAIVHFYDANEPMPLSVEFTETGSMNAWPPGFFDQYRLDITALTKVRRQR